TITGLTHRSRINPSFFPSAAAAAPAVRLILLSLSPSSTAALSLCLSGERKDQCLIMFTASRKIQKDRGTEPSEFEDSVAQAFFDLENTNSELKSDLKDLYINSAEVIVVATRRTVRPPKKGSAAKRPRSRTLTSVHEGILEDVVQPAEIVGKRVRYRLDGSKIMKVYLDPKARNDTENKLDAFSGVYRKLCGKDVVFEYPATEA
ncbi:LOW QUALITY PROTEIN: hypothetical protein V2J09_009181, partial [Rumex salicifolius]